jgi:hypothetical protein
MGLFVCFIINKLPVRLATRSSIGRQVKYTDLSERPLYMRRCKAEIILLLILKQLVLT